MNILLLSNSTMPGEPYLGWCKQTLANFFSSSKVKDVLFIPFAGVNLHQESIIHSYDVYTEKVSSVLSEFGLRITSLHRSNDAERSIQVAQGILVGGGNTFYLVYMLHKLRIMKTIRNRVLHEGVPFAGWSAGSNIACPGLFTTNDMPIIQPASFETLGLIPFQINPHYTDYHNPQHGGETRRQRIAEFLQVNRKMSVIGLPEGTYLQGNERELLFLGREHALWFSFGKAPFYVENGTNVMKLL